MRSRSVVFVAVALSVLACSAVASASVVGTGSPRSCSSAAVIRAVTRGGVITFDCGPRAVTILMRATIRVPKTDRLVEIDGGGRVTLSGGGRHQILFSDTCQGTWSTPDCVSQPFPDIVLAHLTLAHGYSDAQQDLGCVANIPACWAGGVDGGGAVYTEGGRFRAVDDTFVDNRCFAFGPDLGGGAIRALAQYEKQPVRLVHDTFIGNRCSNGGAISSIDTGWDVVDSTFTDNAAIGWGANPAKAGTRGGGSGGAAYFDGKNDDVSFSGTTMSGNTARQGGGAVFDVVDVGSASLTFTSSRLSHNHSGVFETAPGLFYEVDGTTAKPRLEHSND